MAVEWFVEIDSHQRGPYSSAQLKQLVASGIVQRDTRVRKRDSKQWYPARQVKGLFGHPSRVGKESAADRDETSVMPSKPEERRPDTAEPADEGDFYRLAKRPDTGRGRLRAEAVVSAVQEESPSNTDSVLFQVVVDTSVLVSLTLLAIGFAAGLGYLAGYHVPPNSRELAFLTRSGLCVALIGAVWLALSACREDVKYGLLVLLVPFYNFYYVATRRGDLFKPFLVHYGAIALLFSAAGAGVGVAGWRAKAKMLLRPKIEHSLVGTWQAQDGPYRFLVDFSDDNTFIMSLTKEGHTVQCGGTWSLQGNSQVLLRTENAPSPLPGKPLPSVPPQWNKADLELLINDSSFSALYVNSDGEIGQLSIDFDYVTYGFSRHQTFDRRSSAL